MKVFNKNKGITLISLVVTIVILLVLAGISIATLGGENGLIARAKQAKQAQIESDMKEQLTLALQDLQIEKLGEATLDDVTQEWMNEKILDYKCTVQENASISGKKIIMGKNEIICKFLVDEKFNIVEIKINTDDAQLEYEIISRDGENVKILLTISDTKNGLQQVELPNGTIMYCNGEEQIAIDYQVELGVECKVKITSKDGQAKEETILINDYYHKITKNLAEGISIDNTAIKAAYNKPYQATITVGENYIIDTLTVTMGGESVTVDKTTGIISIEKVTGDIEIIATISRYGKILSYSIKDNSENINKKKYNTLKDMTGNNNDAVLTDIYATDEDDGIIFNGISSYAQLNLQEELTFPMTVEMTLKCAEELTNSLLYIEPTSKIGFGIWYGYFVFTINTSAQTVSIPSDFFDGNLKHIVITYSSLTDFEIYINGNKQSKSNSTDTWSAGIGDIPYLGRREQGDYFKGTLYKFRIYKRTISESEILVSYHNDKDFIENGKEEEKREGLILEYGIKNNNENTFIKQPYKLKDMTNNNNDATVYNAEYNDKGEALVFNGTSSYAQLNLQNELTFPMTIEMTLKCAEELTNSLIYLEPTSKTAFGIWYSDFVFTINAESQTVPIPSDFFDGNLKHIVLVYNSLTDFEIYINGEKMEKKTSINAWTAGIGSVPYLGRRGQGDYFNGTLYEFNIYEQTLGKDEISNNYSKMLNSYN